MRITSSLVVAIATLAGTLGAGAQGGSSPVAAVVSQYCSTCHNGVMRSPSGVLLEPYDADRIAANPEAWARVYRQLQAGTMPPMGSPRPDRPTMDTVLAAIERDLVTDVALAQFEGEALARRLARLLWAADPDTALLADARRSGLRDPAVLERHVRRMLADDRAHALVTGFLFSWLELDQLARTDPEPRYFPEYVVSLRESFAKETELFLLSQLRGDRDPLDVWRGGYTFLNEQLARHYGVAGVVGTAFRRVEWPTPERAGLLGHGSILMLTSRHQRDAYAAYTSPAARSKWVRLHFLGAPLPKGFPGAQPVSPDLPLTRQTRRLPAEPCGNCHRNFFPLAYALENFDALGRWRTDDQMGPVDVSGTFVDGASINGVLELRAVLLQRPEAFRTTITEKLLIYADDGEVNASSGTPETLMRARGILRDMPNPRWSAIIAAVARGR